MPKPKTEAATYKQLTVRVPAELVTLLEKQAAAIGRTKNRHAIYVLSYGLGVDDTPPVPAGIAVSA